jgi:hypothetical protein
MNMNLAALIADGLYYGAAGLLAMMALRFIITWLGRLFGFYAPEHYLRWPRLPWRPVYKGYMHCRKWYERTILSGRQATGGFASMLSVLSMSFKPGMLHLGRASAFGIGLLQPVGMKITRHIFMLAMTGSGKTTALITIASGWYGSMYIVDVKAQIVDALSKKDWRTWYVFDPENISKAPGISINVFDCIKEAIQRDGENAAVLWAMRIAEAIIVMPVTTQSAYFYNVSRQFLASLIVHVLTEYPEDYHHLPFIRDLIVKGQYFCGGRRRRAYLRFG